MVAGCIKFELLAVSLIIMVVLVDATVDLIFLGWGSIVVLSFWEMKCRCRGMLACSRSYRGAPTGIKKFLVDLAMFFEQRIGMPSMI